MEFTQVLKEVVWRLVTEERVSYRSIRCDFGLDDEAFEELRFFLVEQKALATDRDSKFLVWTGGTEHAAAPRPISDETLLKVRQIVPYRAEAAALDRPPTAETANSSTEPIGAERRQLTVMFCDLVGSTDLASRLDPEDMADIIRAYQAAATTIIRRFDGYIAKFMGDGIVVYFGFPHAQEKDVERAVRTGLAILEAMPGLNAEIGSAKKAKLAVRIGVATGLVMVGETIGTGAGAEKTVVGETPNLAARLQSLAKPDSIVLSAVTRNLAGDAFGYTDLGTHELKGISEPVRAWSVTGLAEAEAEAEAEATVAVPLLVGRDEEIGLLRRAWQQSRDEKRGQVVLVSGEPGIGKSTLIRFLRADVQRQQLPRITLRCSQYHTNSALYPVIEHFKRASEWQPEDDTATKLAKLERLLSGYKLAPQDAVPLMAALLSLPVPEDRYPALRLTPQQLKQQTADVLVALTLEEAEHQPILQVCEDLHWADPSTLELMGLIIDQAPTVPLLMVLTFRPDFVPPWPNRSHVVPITLSRLERPQIEVLASGLAGGKDLPREMLDYVVRKTDGVPLYVEELTKTVLASGILKEEPERYVLTGPLSNLSIPASLQEMLMARLDRLPMVREVAQLGAVFGREFAYEMLQAIGVFEEAKLRDGLGQLVGAELLYQRGRPPRATYTFKHALIQDAAYQSLLKRTRQHYHRQAATLLESQFPEVVEAQPELVAHHYAESGGAEQAITYVHNAGQQAARRSANREVIAHAMRALNLLKALPATPDHAASELALQRLLGTALMVTKGYGALETGMAFERARELCEVAGASEDLCPVLAGVWLFEMTRAKHAASREIAEKILFRASATGDPESLIVGHVAAATSDVHAGAPALARPHFERAIALHETHRPAMISYRYGIDFGAAAYAYAAWCEWLLGRPDQALRLGNRGLAEIDREKHTYTVSRGYYWNAVLHQLRGEWPVVLERAKLAKRSGKEHGFALVAAAARIMQGSARAALGDAESGIRDMRKGLEAYRLTGARFQRPYHMVLLADALRNGGKVEDALAVLADAANLIGETGERYYEAETHRLRGILLLARDRAEKTEAIASLLAALDIARKQQAKSLELRAARDLATVWAEGGERQKAHDILHSICETFTEGFDTSAIASSRQLLESLH